MKKDLPENTLSPEEAAISQAVSQIDALINNVCDSAETIRETIHDALDVTKPCRWQEVCEDTREAVSIIWAAIEKANERFTKKYKLD